MSDYKPLRCFWCGYIFHPLDGGPDEHKLWCGSRPADA